MENGFYDELKHYFETTPREIVLRDWEEVEKHDNVGPTINEYTTALKSNTLKEKLYVVRMIDKLWDSVELISIHRTKEGAEVAIDKHKENVKLWYETNYIDTLELLKDDPDELIRTNEDHLKYPWDYDKRWTISEYELLD